jgi:hypothetical protein
VSRIDPRTGKLAPVATLTSAYPQEEPSPSVSMLESWQATTFEGSLFILDPTTPVPPTTPAPEAAIEAGGFLYRVTPSGL